jgi:hypothetical protein
LGTKLYPAAEGRFIVKGMSVCAGFMFLAAVLPLILRTHLVWENRKAEERGREARAEMGDDEKTFNIATENTGFGFQYIL